MPIEHIGLAVPDVEAAARYYDDLMPLVGYQPCFGNGYCPDDYRGTQLFLYAASDDRSYSRHAAGLQHLAFLVPTRAEVDRVHGWVRERGDETLHPPQTFPEYGPHCYATYFIDPHGFVIEVVCQTSQDGTAG